MEILLNIAHWFGAGVCDQLETHSYEFAGVTLPLCARCTGLYLGTLITLLFHAWRHPRATGMPGRWMLALLGAFFLAWAGDGVNSVLSVIPIAPHLYPPSNLLRLITGTLMGISIGSFLWLVFNSMVWQVPSPEKILSSGWELVALVVLGGLLIFVVQTEFDVLLYPLVAAILISILILHCGLMAALTTGLTRRITRWRQLTPALLIAAIIAITYLSVFAQLHMMLIPQSLG
jgi:uncharacterized membrane protein